jgi:hypothetical protein
MKVLMTLFLLALGVDLSYKSKFLAVLGGRALKPPLDRSRMKRLEALSPEVAG